MERYREWQRKLGKPAQHQHLPLLPSPHDLTCCALSRPPHWPTEPSEIISQRPSPFPWISQKHLVTTMAKVTNTQTLTKSKLVRRHQHQTKQTLGQVINRMAEGPVPNGRRTSTLNSKWKPHFTLDAKLRKAWRKLAHLPLQLRLSMLVLGDCYNSR